MDNLPDVDSEMKADGGGGKGIRKVIAADEVGMDGVAFPFEDKEGVA